MAVIVLELFIVAPWTGAIIKALGATFFLLKKRTPFPYWGVSGLCPGPPKGLGPFGNPIASL